MVECWYSVSFVIFLNFYFLNLFLRCRRQCAYTHKLDKSICLWWMIDCCSFYLLSFSTFLSLLSSPLFLISSPLFFNIFALFITVQGSVPSHTSWINPYACLCSDLSTVPRSPETAAINTCPLHSRQERQQLKYWLCLS